MGKSVSIPQAAVALLPLTWGYERGSLCETVSKKNSKKMQPADGHKGRALHVDNHY